MTKGKPISEKQRERNIRKCEPQTEWLSREDYAIAKSNGISTQTAYSRFNFYGYTREDAITEPVQKADYSWRDYEKIAKKHGVSRYMFSKAVKQGMSYEDAATGKLKKQKGARARILSDKEFKIATKNGISRKLANYRIQKLHWDRKRAITEPRSDKYIRKDINFGNSENKGKFRNEGVGS